MSQKETLFFKKEKALEFMKKAESFGFHIEDDSYYRRNYIDKEQDLYLLITINVRRGDVYIEMNIPAAYWIELGFEYFEPLLDLYREGFLEIGPLPSVVVL